MTKPARTLFLALILVVFQAVASGAAERRAYILSTATTGGTYYPVGVAIATLTKIKLEPATGVSLSAISSAGSAENVKLIREKVAQFAIMQGIYGLWAYRGEGRVARDGPQTHLRSLTMLWRNVEHFVVRAKYVRTGTMDDLRTLGGARFSIGKKYSGAEGSGRNILTRLGIDAEGALDLVYMGYGQSAEALQNGLIAGMNIPAGPPVAAVTRAFAALGDKAAILEFTDQHLAALNVEDDLYVRWTLPAGTYPGQVRPVNTVAEPNVLVVHAEVDEDAVYLITKTIYENLPFLHGIHGITRTMTLENAIVGLPAPLHPGAARYYRERGLAVDGPGGG